MKAERQLGILTILLRRGQATLEELAARFEVSKRTIQRDLDDLCGAGIPLYAQRGRGGGICIQSGYHIPETLLTQGELTALMAGLQGVDSVSSGDELRSLREKLAVPDTSWIDIDLSAGSRQEMTRKFETVKAAILSRRLLSFTYLYGKGESERRVEPHRLVYKWGNWYLLAFCLLRGDFRLFRLGRMRGTKALEERFVPRPIPPGLLLPDPRQSPLPLTALYAPMHRYRLMEEQEGCALSAEADGRLRATCFFASEPQRLAWALSFGDGIEVIDPPDLRREIARQAQNILSRER